MVRQEEEQETVINTKNFNRMTIKQHRDGKYIPDKQMFLNRKIMAFVDMYKKNKPSDQLSPTAYNLDFISVQFGLRLLF